MDKENFTIQIRCHEHLSRKGEMSKKGETRDWPGLLAAGPRWQWQVRAKWTPYEGEKKLTNLKNHDQ
jgi:hypothetical protein